MIHPPERIHANPDRDTVTFENRKPLPEGPLPEDYDPIERSERYVRGAIAWPTMTPVAGGAAVQGAALVAGLDVRTQDVTIYAVRLFSAIDHVVSRQEDGSSRIEFEGIAPWFTLAWATFACRQYYWQNVDDDTAHAWQLQVYRSTQIEPKPDFVHIRWSEAPTALSDLWLRVQKGQLEFSKGGLVEQALTLGQTDPSRITGPVMAALVTLSMGLRRYPWRKRT